MAVSKIQSNNFMVLETTTPTTVNATQLIVIDSSLKGNYYLMAYAIDAGDGSAWVAENSTIETLFIDSAGVRMNVSGSGLINKTIKLFFTKV